MIFFDRARETDTLKTIQQQSLEHAQFTVLTGRRRIGKTSLVLHAYKDMPFLYFFVSKKAETALCEDYQQEIITKLGVPLLGKVLRFADIFEYIMQIAKQQPITLFIDEFHRFSKSQQDSLLGAVEDGTIKLIGATTENQSFEVITPLLSRCQVYVLKSLEKADLLEMLHRALTEDEHIRSLNIEVQETESMLRYSGGDARKLLNIIELVTNSGVKVIDNETVTKQLQQNPVAYDKDGELHYDIISAFIKSIRGSDPDAALYWLARMVAAGEDPKFIARRLVISASEDIGLANPNAMLVANACFDTLQKIGWPEGRIPLAMATVYLATSQKSNSAYLPINPALALVENTGNLPVPLHLRNAPTTLMDELGYGEGYKYAHDFPNHFVKQQFMPDALQGTRLWHAQGSPQEQKMAEWMKYLWENDKK